MAKTVCHPKRAPAKKAAKKPIQKKAPAKKTKAAKKPAQKKTTKKAAKSPAKSTQKSKKTNNFKVGGTKASTEDLVVVGKTPQQTIMLTNGEEMPLMGFGTFTMSDGGPVETAIKAGYRHIDTASRYKNEEVVGQAIKNSIKAGIVKRSDIFLTTKIFHDEYYDVEGALRRSLKKLQTNYVDMYLIHWPNNFFCDKKNQQPMHVLWGKMEKLVEKGLTRAIGVSNFNTQLLADILTYAKIPPACNQICIFPSLAQPDFIRFLTDHSIVPVAWGPLGRVGSAIGATTNVNFAEDALIRYLSKRYNRTASQILLGWGLSRGCVVIPKASSLVHQKENIAASQFRLLQKDVDSITARFDKGTHIFPHTGDNKYNVFA